ncbi:MAG: RNA polymerase sigma factor [Solirubrobacteraceae bacterium]
MFAQEGSTACSTLIESRAADPAQRSRRPLPYVLDTATLPDHLDALYRAAWALCGSRTEAEDLVQTTFLQVLKRPRIIRDGNERAYLLRALRNAHATRYRTLARHPKTVPLLEDDTGPGAEVEATVSSRDLMEAVASARPLYRDAVIAVDILGLSYREAARSLRTREETLTSRLHRGRQHIARELIERGV